jgi:hypothetical protein
MLKAQRKRESALFASFHLSNVSAHARSAVNQIKKATHF